MPTLAPRAIATLAALAMLYPAAALSQAPKVVASIKPVHSLTAAIMEGVGTPELLIKGGGSPHSYALKPSEAKALQQSALVVWVGEGLETFLEKPLRTLPKKAVRLELAEAPGVRVLEPREGGGFAEHDHGHGHNHKHGHKHDHDHHHEADLHLWLDPANAKAMAAAIQAALVKLDPANKAAYERNGAALAQRLDALTAELDRDLAPVKGKPFVVFHDAYQYLEARFGLNAVGSITISPERAPSAARVAEIRKKIQSLNAVCVFSEPQFEPRLVTVVTQDTTARTGVLDPLGADLPDGPALYETLMRRNAKALKDCLAQ